ncbi:MAG: division/cell wall cluster transcriptional repressor MraZ, partial [Eubacterium sp.]|nr:division/cell wall cluster transcriptional repressor MraZ [Eubacterium sp.]
KLSNLPFADKKVRDFNRFFLAGASDLETDKLGRILMPSVLRGFASLDKEVVWAGVGNRIEIWDIDKWNEKMSAYIMGGDEESESSIEDVAEYLASMGV